MNVEQAANAGVAVARSVASGEPYVDLMLHELVQLVEVDAGGGLVRWDPRVDTEMPLVDQVQTRRWSADEIAAAARVVPLHPSFAPVPPQTHRVSDRVGSMREFWATDVFAAMHGPLGGRFPLAVPLVLASPTVVHMGFMRSAPDFSDDEVEAVELFARPIRAALAFRAVLDDVVGHQPLERHEGPHFTRKEVDVLVLVAAGWTDGHIARRLRISEATVRQRLTTARDRVGAVNRTHLVVRWLELTGRVADGRAARAWAADET